MQEWQEQSVRVGNLVRDTAEERGSGRVAKVYPRLGCDVDFPAGQSFLGFGWLEKGNGTQNLDDIPVDF